MKLCGRNELCFTNGDECWGHFGGIMCKHLGEENKGGGLTSRCHLDNTKVSPCPSALVPYKILLSR